MSTCKIHQIYYSPESFAALDSGFIPFDNTNGRPENQEYGAIRQFFLNQPVGEDDLIGFFSPRFHEKTGLTAPDVNKFINDNPGKDIYLFNPYFHLCAWNQNIFLQAEAAHPGLIKATNEVLKILKIDIDVSKLVMSSVNTVYCNYFVAKMNFWREWLAFSEFIYQMAEANTSEIERIIRKNTTYLRGPLPMQVFMIERIASLLLTISGPWEIASKLLYKDMQYRAKENLPFLEKMHTLDALKTSFIQTKNEMYIKAFNLEKNELASNFYLSV